MSSGEPSANGEILFAVRVVWVPYRDLPDLMPGMKSFQVAHHRFEATCERCGWEWRSDPYVQPSHVVSDVLINHRRDCLVSAPPTKR